MFKKPGRKKWYVRITDGSGKRRDYPLSADRGVAQAMEQRLRRRLERCKAGIDDSYIEYAQMPIQGHLDDFRAYLTDNRNTEKYVNLTLNRISAIIAGCKVKRISDIRSTVVKSWLNKQAFSPTSFNNYLQAIKSFCRWLVAHRRLQDNPLAAAKPINTSDDLRHQRRALSAVDFARLLAVTKYSPRIIEGVSWRLSGADRHMLYLIASYTGLRASEIASLTVKSFDFSKMTVTVNAKNTKNKKEAILPLHPELAIELQEYFSSRQIDDLIFPGRWNEIGASILRRDLAEANIPYEDNGRVFDFHCLRGQFITTLARNDVPLVKVQKLARHSTPALTSKYYTHLTTTDLTEAIESLPPINPQIENLKNSA